MENEQSRIIKKVPELSPEVKITFFLEKLFERNCIDSETYVIAKKLLKEESRNVVNK